ncbi:hypothetical protein [Salinarchaeum sp. Harcht-Bsk1]|uniref:hypothetical protein n=1 Tax=Salinarchaeum sp. Harcht-Bsk1 TaxID=1333523 RepID=UPI001181AB2C|nr:hypothetical protein [Salinarchaeum sp. Harcht-Bsk1]
MAGSCESFVDSVLEDRHTAVLNRYLQMLDNADDEKVEIPKSELPALPCEFEEHYPANGMQRDGAEASYRDQRKTDSVHIIEYPDHWTVHIDDHNPKHNDQKIPHLVNDAPGALLLAAVVIGVFLHHNT